MSDQTPSQFPYPLDRGEPRASGRQEQQLELFGVLPQEGLQQHGMTVAGLVEHHDHAAPASPIAQQLFEEAPENLGVEYGADVVDDLHDAQIDRSKAVQGSARRVMQQKGRLVLRQHQHAPSRPMRLETALIQTPQRHIRLSSQTSQHVLRPQVLADHPERFADAAYAAESPSGETIFGVAAHPDPRHGNDPDDQRAPEHRASQPDRNPASSRADHPRACVTVSNRECRADLISSPSLKAPSQPCSKRRIERCTVAPSSQSSSATSRQDRHSITSNSPCRRWSHRNSSLRPISCGAPIAIRSASSSYRVRVDLLP